MLCDLQGHRGEDEEASVCASCWARARGNLREVRAALEELGLALADAGHQWTPRQRGAWEKADRLLGGEGGWRMIGPNS